MEGFSPLTPSKLCTSQIAGLELKHPRLLNPTHNYLPALSSQEGVYLLDFVQGLQRPLLFHFSPDAETCAKKGGPSEAASLAQREEEEEEEQLCVHWPTALTRGLFSRRSASRLSLCHKALQVLRNTYKKRGLHVSFLTL